MNTTHRSYWIMMSYLVKGEQWWWLSGIMTSSMLLALERASGEPASQLEIEEHSDKHWSAISRKGHRQCIVEYEVYMQDERPPLVNEKRTQINDFRDTALRIAGLQKTPILKPVPTQLKFKYES